MFSGVESWGSHRPTFKGKISLSYFLAASPKHWGLIGTLWETLNRIFQKSWLPLGISSFNTAFPAF